MFTGLGRFLIIAGIILVIFGLLFNFWPKIPLPGKLPGDIVIQKGNFHFFFPLVTSLLLSLILTMVINFVIRLFRQVKK